MGVRRVVAMTPRREPKPAKRNGVAQETAVELEQRADRIMANAATLQREAARLYALAAALRVKL